MIPSELNSGHVVNICAVLADQPSSSVRAVLAMLSKSTTPAVSKALALEDIAIFRAVHSSTLLYPSDAISLERLTETMVDILWRRCAQFHSKPRGAPRPPEKGEEGRPIQGRQGVCKK